MKKSMLKFVILFSLIILFISCSKKTQNGEKSDKKKITITFWAYEPTEINGRELYKKILDMFYKKYPEIRVKIVYITKDGSKEKLRSAIVTNSLPDCSYLDYASLPSYAKGNTIYNLEELFPRLKEKPILDDFYKGVETLCKYKNKFYALPLSQQCVALFYNKDLIKKPPKTWDEMIKIAKKIYKPGKIAAFDVPQPNGWGAWFFPAFLYSAGGKLIDESGKKVLFNSEAGVKALNLWKELLKYSPKDIIYSAYAFESGKIGMELSGRWEIMKIEANFPNLNYGITLVPKDKKYATNMGADLLVVYKSSKHPIAALKFIYFLTTPEVQRIVQDIVGGLPIRKGLEKYWKDDEKMQIFLKQAEYAVPPPSVPGWAKINDVVIADAIREVLDGKLSAQEALNKAAERANKILQEEAE